MGFDSALGDIQILCDLGVVATLKQQVNDLLFAISQLANLLFHGGTPPSGAFEGRRARAALKSPMRTPDNSGLAQTIAPARPNLRKTVN